MEPLEFMERLAALVPSRRPITPKVREKRRA
jgi:hypothetical protein